MNAKQRKYVYGVIGTIVPLLVTLGILSNEIAGHIMAIAASVLSLAGSVLALNNINED